MLDLSNAPLKMLSLYQKSNFFVIWAPEVCYLNQQLMIGNSDKQLVETTTSIEIWRSVNQCQLRFWKLEPYLSQNQLILI